MRDLVFINWRTGAPAKNSSYDAHLKVLQKLLGHASIKATMDRCVHVTDDVIDQAVKQFEKNRVSA
jgi:integrase